MYISRPFPPGRQCSSSPATARKIFRVFLQACLNNQHFPPFYISNATINMTSTQTEAQKRAILFARNFVDSLTEEVSNIFHHNSKVLTFFRGAHYITQLSATGLLSPAQLRRLRRISQHFPDPPPPRARSWPVTIVNSPVTVLFLCLVSWIIFAYHEVFWAWANRAL